MKRKNFGTAVIRLRPASVSMVGKPGYMCLKSGQEKIRAGPD